MEELYSVRTALELLALDRSIERMTDDEIDHLDVIVEEMRVAARNGDLSHLVEIDLYFHEYLLAKADHELALNLWLNLEVGMKRCLRTRHKIYTFLDEVVGSHPTLITALKARDKAQAKQILSDHIAESLQHLLANWPADSRVWSRQWLPRPAASQEWQRGCRLKKWLFIRHRCIWNNSPYSLPTPRGRPILNGSRSWRQPRRSGSSHLQTRQPRHWRRCCPRLTPS